jgi:preprotein translocase subunit SecA
MSVFSNIFKDTSYKNLKKYEAFLPRINEEEKELTGITDEALRGRVQKIKAEIQAGTPSDEKLPEVFALVREAAKRTLNQRHYDAQLLGGAILYFGNIAEMKTGEGKTLVATLPTTLRALAGKGVHVVTVNDYLARRDAVWMGQVYAMLGLSVGILNHNESFVYDASVKNMLDTTRDAEGSYHVVNEFLRPVSRKEAYAADITYGTNSEYGFDYLRDNLVYQARDMVQRGHHFAIVDEVDSILIDEARTPLIISAPVGMGESLYPRFAQIAKTLIEDEDYKKDEKTRSVALTEAGIEKAEKALGVENIYTEKGIKYVHHLETAVRAQALFARDKDYVVREGEVVIVDSFTGRLQPGRRWSEGLHQAVEAKEGVVIKEESRTFATISYQNYFRMYEKLAGMTGTALTSAEEFAKVYGLETLVVPTHRPSARNDHPDFIFQTEKGKTIAIAKKIKELNTEGRPVLVGTVSIENNEVLSAHLTKEGVPHQILNAKNHEREGEIIASAGKKGSVVIATNMAGRGVDIKLGGTHATPEETEEVKKAGGLFVLGTERHEARRIDNQLRGRAGRQGDPGETQFFVSLEDSLMRVFGGDRVKNMMGRFGIPEDEPIQNGFISKALEQAQGKIEGLNFDARKHLLEFDDVMNHQRGIIYGKRNAVLRGDAPALTEILADISALAENQDEIQKHIAEKKEVLGEGAFLEAFRNVYLQSLDMLWVEHLEAMDHMRSSVNLRAYGQRDPLQEYKKEGLRLFRDLEMSLGHQILSVIPHIATNIKTEEQKNLQTVHNQASIITGQAKEVPRPQAGAAKIGRNDICPCGSGKKYKHCGLINAPEHTK